MYIYPYISDHDTEGDQDDFNIDKRETELFLNPAPNRGRYRRAPVFMDSGYGSRFSAASELARDLSLRKLFGGGGPGKRAYMVRNELYPLFRELTKRDHGYGSRVRAGHNMINAKLARQNLFGAYGPGRKRNINDINTNILEDQVDRMTLGGANFDSNGKDFEPLNSDAYLQNNYLPMRRPGIGRLFARPRQSYTIQSDGNKLPLDEGYRSRIEAGNQLAHDLETQEKIFGKLGPGRK